MASATYQLADIRCEGHLADILRRMRAEGASFNEIARSLFADHGVEVTGETVRVWCNNLQVQAS